MQVVFEFKEKYLSWLTQRAYREWTDKEIGSYMKELFEEQKREYDGWVDSQNTFEKKRYMAWIGISYKKVNEIVENVQDVQLVHGI